MSLDWRDSAACVGQDPEAWFPSDGDPGLMAKKICHSCPVQNECLEYALTERLNSHGIYGGTSAKQRQRMKRPAP